MKNITELYNKIESFVKITEAVKKQYPEINNLEFKIQNVPLKVILAFAEKTETKPSYTNYQKLLSVSLYEFSNKFGKFRLYVESVPVEEIKPEPKPITLATYKEVKGKDKSKSWFTV